VSAEEASDQPDPPSGGGSSPTVPQANSSIFAGRASIGTDDGDSIMAEERAHLKRSWEQLSMLIKPLKSLPPSSKDDDEDDDSI
jgi:hypothetical protein